MLRKPASDPSSPWCVTASHLAALLVITEQGVLTLKRVWLLGAILFQADCSGCAFRFCRDGRRIAPIVPRQEVDDSDGTAFDRSIRVRQNARICARSA